MEIIDCKMGACEGPSEPSQTFSTLLANRPQLLQQEQLHFY